MTKRKVATQHPLSGVTKNFVDSLEVGPRLAAEQPVRFLVRVLIGIGRFRNTRDVFEGRVEPRNVQAWFVGRRPIPQWAYDILAQHARAHLADMLTAIEHLQHGPGRSARHLRDIPPGRRYHHLHRTRD